MNGLSVTSLSSVLAITATGNGAAVDVGNYHGIGLLVLNSGAGNAGTSTIKVQDSEDGTNDWADVTGGAFTAVATTASEQALKINTDRLRKFVRVVDTLAGGANAISRSVSLIGKKQYS